MFKQEQTPEPIRYWMVTLTLTSSEEINFYVKAKTHRDALILAEDYKFIGEVEKLKENTRNKLMLKY